MMLRAAIVFLLMLNLGVAVWWLGANRLDRGPAAALIDGRQPGLRLINEPVAAKRVVSPVTSTMPSMPGRTKSAPIGPPATPVVAVPATARCLSFGPFADPAARDLVRPRLQALAQKVVARDAPAKSARGWRVYLPALPSREAAVQRVEQIKAAGINDWYIIANGSEANSIALGRYGNEASARTRQVQLTGKGFPARAEPLGESPPQWWLDARLPVDANRATLAAIAPSKPLDCAYLR